jgi:Uma2 family endonuclease
VVKVPPPKKRHSAVQNRVNRLLLSALGDAWYVQSEFPFKVGEHEAWVADVAVTAASRWAAVPDDSWFSGAPEIVIEVLSPSNTVGEMFDREQTCFQGGCREFWVVDSDTRQVYVTSPDGPRRTYRAGDQVPIAVLSGASLAVDLIFQVPETR